MAIETKRFARKPFYIEAVQVTAENIVQVSDWCRGAVMDKGPNSYIKVGVLRPMNSRQTKAFVGDWVLYAGTSFKVYTVTAFENSFEPVFDSIEKFEESIIEPGAEEKY